MTEQSELTTLISSLSEKIEDLSKKVNTIPAKVQKYYSKKEVQEILGCGKSVLDRYIAYGMISYSRPDGDKYYFSDKDITDFMSNNHYPVSSSYMYGTRS